MLRKHTRSRRAQHASWVTTLARSNQWLMLLFLALIAIVGFALWQQHEQTDVKGASTVAAVTPSVSPKPQLKMCVVLKRFAVVNPCGNDNYRGAVYQCGTGNPVTIGNSTSCKSIALWLSYATCKGKVDCTNGNLTPTPSLHPRPTCIPRPSCLTSTPRCAIAEPVGGWCPPNASPTPTAAFTPTPTLANTPTPTPHQ